MAKFSKTLPLYCCLSQIVLFPRPFLQAKVAFINWISIPQKSFGQKGIIITLHPFGTDAYNLLSLSTLWRKDLVYNIRNIMNTTLDKPTINIYFNITCMWEIMVFTFKLLRICQIYQSFSLCYMVAITKYMWPISYLHSLHRFSTLTSCNAAFSWANDTNFCFIKMENISIKCIPNTLCTFFSIYSTFEISCKKFGIQYICDWILENHSKSHIYKYEKY